MEEQKKIKEILEKIGQLGFNEDELEETSAADMLAMANQALPIWSAEWDGCIEEVGDDVAERLEMDGVRRMVPSYSKQDAKSMDHRSKKVWEEIQASPRRAAASVSRGTQTDPAEPMTTKQKSTDQETQTGEPTGIGRWAKLYWRLQHVFDAEQYQKTAERQVFRDFHQACFKYQKEVGPLPDEAAKWKVLVDDAEEDSHVIDCRRTSRMAERRKREEEERQLAERREELKRKAEKAEEELRKKKEEYRRVKEEWKKAEREKAFAEHDRIFLEKEERDRQLRQERRQRLGRSCPVCDYPGVSSGRHCPNKAEHRFLPERKDPPKKK